MGREGPASDDITYANQVISRQGAIAQFCMGNSAHRASGVERSSFSTRATHLFILMPFFTHKSLCASRGAKAPIPRKCGAVLDCNFPGEGRRVLFIFTPQFVYNGNKLLVEYLQ